MKKLLTLMAVIFFTGCAKEEFDGSRSAFEVSEKKTGALKTSDGGFLIFEIDRESIGMSRVNREGISVWNREHPGTLVNFPYFVQPNAVTVTQDDEAVLIGSFSDSLYGYEFYKLFRFGANGDIITNEIIDTFFYSGSYSPVGLVQVDGGALISNNSYNTTAAGSSNHLLENPNNQHIFQVCPGQVDDYGWFSEVYMFPTDDGGFAMIARDDFSPVGFPEILKYDSLGCCTFRRPMFFQGSGIGHPVIPVAAVSRDGNIYVTGHTNAGKDEHDVFLLCLTNSGTLIRLEFFGTPLNDIVSDMAVCPDGGFVITGARSSEPVSGAGYPDTTMDFNSELFLMKISSGIQLEWNNTYSSRHGSNGLAVNASQNGFLLLGEQNSHGNRGVRQQFFLRLDPSGNIYE
jgi:hypothetical protein